MARSRSNALLALDGRSSFTNTVITGRPNLVWKRTSLMNAYQGLEPYFCLRSARRATMSFGPVRVVVGEVVEPFVPVFFDDPQPVTIPATTAATSPSAMKRLTAPAVTIGLLLHI